jgi:hypothetical protein
MKTPEDEAFDELAQRQGAWGGGFQAKRQAAMDKINAEFHEEYIKYRTAFPKEYTAPQPAQEPVADRLERLLWEYIDLQAAHPEHRPDLKTWPHLMIYAPQPAQEPPKYAIKAYWEDDGRIGVVATVERPDGGYHLLGAIIDPPPAKDKNT